MIISYKWLRKYFPGSDLPAVNALADLLTMHFAEIESVDEQTETLDIKITPDRGCYGLTHAGVAYEVTALTGGKNAAYLQTAFPVTRTDMSGVESKTLAKVVYDGCQNFYIAEVHLGAPNTNSQTLKEVQSLLAIIGQRSISPLVDILNFITFDIGQPLHAFDADKVTGTMAIRQAKTGETMTTLDGHELRLSTQDAVTADDAAVLDLIGVKGGKVAETTEETQHIYLKAALYDKADVRRASKRHNLRTDAAKRFEQGIDTQRSWIGIRYALSLIAEIYPESKVASYQEYFADPKSKNQTQNEILLKTVDVTSYLGIEIAENKIITILESLGCTVRSEGDGFMVLPPAFRLDIRIDRDLIEEIARVHGMQEIPSKSLPEIVGQDTSVTDDNLFVFLNALRQTLVANGAVELMTYSLYETGELEILNPVSPERSHARTTIAQKFEQALRVFGPESATVGYDDITVFEIGSVFSEKIPEEVHLCVGVRAYKFKEKFVKVLLDDAKQVIEDMCTKIGLSISLADITVSESVHDGVGVLELNLSAIVSKLADLRIEMSAERALIQSVQEFVPPSQYPSVVRDVAFFAPATVSEEALTDLIVSNTSDLLVNVWAFDRFVKPGEDMVSFGFRLVFQSSERTLTDVEVQKDVENVLAALTQAGYSPRV